MGLGSIRMLDAPVARRPTVSQWPVTRARQPAFFLRERVLQCESMCVAGEAHTRGACVSSVFCTRVLVCQPRRGPAAGGEPAGRQALRMRDMPLVSALNSDASEFQTYTESQCVLIQGSFLQRTSRAFCTVCAPRHSPAAPQPCCAAAAGRRGAANRPPRDRCQPRNNSAESGSNSKSNCGIGAIALHPLDLLRHGAQSIIGIRKSQEAQ